MLIAFKLKLVLACAAGLAGPIAVAPLVSDMAVRGTATEPAIVKIAPGNLSYREAGDFTRGRAAGGSAAARDAVHEAAARHAASGFVIRLPALRAGRRLPRSRS
ncbi:hypothetical protein ABIF54_001582 [Bradyrhizobium japonicum]